VIKKGTAAKARKGWGREGKLLQMGDDRWKMKRNSTMKLREV